MSTKGHGHACTVCVLTLYLSFPKIVCCHKPDHVRLYQRSACTSKFFFKSPNEFITLKVFCMDWQTKNMDCILLPLLIFYVDIS